MEASGFPGIPLPAAERRGLEWAAMARWEWGLTHAMFISPKGSACWATGNPEQIGREQE